MPISFTVRTTAGTFLMSLAQLLHTVEQCEPFDLPNLAPHQRPQMVEILAIVIAVARVCGSTNRKWAVADWDAFLRPLPMELVTDEDEPAFLQAVLPRPALPAPKPPKASSKRKAKVQTPPQPVGPPARPWKAIPFQTVDFFGASTASMHSVKPTMAVSREAATYALIGGLRAWACGVGHSATIRSRLMTFLVSEDGSLGGEIRNLAEAYVREGIRTNGDLSEHFIHAQPWIDKQDLTTIPVWPFIDCREVRLFNHPEDPTLVRAAYLSVPRRILPGWINDPHVARLSAVNKKTNQPFVCAVSFTSDRLRWSVIAAAVFTEKNVSRARTIVQGTPVVVRVNAISNDQSKCNSFQEVILRLDDNVFDDEDRVSVAMGQLKKRIATIENNVFKPVVRVVFGETDPQNQPKTNAFVKPLIDRIGMMALQETINAIGSNVPTSDLAAAIDEFIVQTVRSAWIEALQSIPLMVAAQASLEIDQSIRKTFKRKDKQTMFVDQDAYDKFSKVLWGLGRSMDDSTRKLVRSNATTSTPWAVFGLLSGIPDDLMTTPYQRDVWCEAIKGLARFEHGGTGIGRLFAQIDYPENRVATLLSASGDAFVAHLSEAIRFIGVKADRANLTDLIIFGVTGDREAAIRIAMTYHEVSRLRQARQAA